MCKERKEKLSTNSQFFRYSSCSKDLKGKKNPKITKRLQYTDLTTPSLCV